MQGECEFRVLLVGGRLHLSCLVHHHWSFVVRRFEMANVLLIIPPNIPLDLFNHLFYCIFVSPTTTTTICTTTGIRTD